MDVLHIEAQSSLQTPTIFILFPLRNGALHQCVTLETDEGANEQKNPNETSWISSGFSEWSNFPKLCQFDKTLNDVSQPSTGRTVLLGVTHAGRRWDRGGASIYQATETAGHFPLPGMEGNQI